MKNFLKVSGKNISHNGKQVTLRGLNLGGWLMMEGYILHARNIAEQSFKKDFSRELGSAALIEFEKSFRDNFIREDDFKQIVSWGFNCIRLPFNHRLIEKTPAVYDEKGLAYLDRALAWAKKYGLWVILDLHGAAGAQNYDWHSDSLGRAELWEKQSNRERTYALWEFLADRYKDNPAVAGYDLLNEAVLDDTKLLNTFYKNVIERIRRKDPNHIIFIEGNRWAMDLECLDDFGDDNVVLSAHFYHPLEFTFNFIPHLSYPLVGPKGTFGKKAIRELVQKYAALAQKRDLPIFVGEFGVNARMGLFGEEHWVADTLDCLRQFGFHWTYWTYKAVKNAAFPDGIYSYYPNDPWVNRQGPKLGWENYAAFWPQRRNDIIRSWRTENFKVNGHILKALQSA